jgi:hypothetical protein
MKHMSPEARRLLAECIPGRELSALAQEIADALGANRDAEPFGVKTERAVILAVLKGEES